MRTVYIVTYDVSDDKRWRKVFEVMKGYGDHLQYSVFRCSLSARAKVSLMERLSQVIKHDEDQVLFFSLGSEDSFDASQIEVLGRQCEPPRRGAIVV
ncbi:MAG: CRISPR-associated endonuclease Cas2 [Anaerolineae bacterium]|nr:CRISPR-associated endonuclease Cas2 [Thermoflexales bacterium]MCX7938009.1 CRISPR-associated endonuclease Cas2 [Thermoflexales bacterium]MDW8396904.1 CRISPR-associated endonuclease Cas2 [Anaerolineae bacterium]